MFETYRALHALLGSSDRVPSRAGNIADGLEHVIAPCSERNDRSEDDDRVGIA